MGWLKDPYEWAKGKSGYVYLEFPQVVRALQREMNVRVEEEFEIKLSPEHETRKFTRVYVRDLFLAYMIINSEQRKISWGM
jgi:hypothetical protein